MKISNVALLSVAAATAIAAPLATVTVHQHVKQTVVVEGYVYVNGATTTTGYRTVENPVAVTAVATTAAEAPVTTAAAVEAAATTAAAVAPEIQDADVNESTEAATVATPADIATTYEQPATTQAEPTQEATQAAAASSNSDSGSSSFASEMLNAHNQKRALHQDTPSLSWSDDLASYAQNYADAYDCSGSLTHSGGPYGENLAIGYGTSGAVDGWYSEIKDYDFGASTYSAASGHFTQVVWKASTELGCGVKSCGGLWGDYVICSYNPAGNMIGDFAANVKPLK